MEHLAASLRAIQQKMNSTYLSETCNKHSKPVQLMMFNGEPTCPRCFCEADTEKVKAAEQERFEQIIKNEKRIVFYKESMIADETIKNATLENYRCECPETTENLQKAKQALEDYKQGKVFTLFFAGKTGTGKSHLAHGIAKELNEVGTYKVLFVTISELLRKIKATFRNNSTETEDGIIQKLIQADYLVLDDLGAELGDLDSDEKATKFINNVLFAVLEGRQGKSLLITTNLTGTKIKESYDARIVSRMFRNFRHIKFEKTTDKRPTEIPF